MTLTAHPFRRLFSRTRAAARRRRGSVLILVVALLVLLLIIGTAFLTTSRTERYAAVQDTVNTQADLLMQGVESLLSDQVVGKLYVAPSGVTVPNTFRYAANALAQYSHSYESTASDLYLASRVPESPTSGVSTTASVTLEQPTVGLTVTQWPSISLIPTPGVRAGSPLCEIDGLDGSRMVLIWSYVTGTTYARGDIVTVLGADPQLYYTPKTGAVSSNPSLSATAVADWDTVDPKQAFRFVPKTTSVYGQTVIAFGVYNTIVGKAVPAFGPTKTIKAPAPNQTFGASFTADFSIPAADADGDGVPDSGLVKLPVGQIDGVTYYAAVRVVDGNSAVNASSAWRADTDPDTSAGGATAYLGMFRSNVGLQQLLWPASVSASPPEMDNLNGVRFGASSANSSPVLDTGVARGDFAFLTQGDALDSQLTRRAAFPGYNTTAIKYQWFGQTLTAALANRFCLNSTSLAPTLAETSLFNELRLSQTTPYSTNGVTNWFNNNFNFSTTGVTPTTVTYNAVPNPATAATPIPMPLRSVLVGSNPVSNAVNGHYTNRGDFNPTTDLAKVFYFGDWVTINSGGNANNGRCYMCVMDNTTGIDPSTIPPPVPFTPTAGGTTVPVTVAANKNWEYVPWTNMPVKASANTATFGQLWASYWNVMWDHPTPGTVAAGVAPQTLGAAQPAFGLPVSADDTRNNQVANNEEPTVATPATSLQARTFRNPIRDPGTVTAAASATVQYMTPGQMMVLRSAAAALNTISLRQASGTTLSTVGSTVSPPLNGLDNVITRQITIPADPADKTGNHIYDVMLYGATKQPYISEVFVQANTDPTLSYIAIELCNPYPTAMTLTGWQIAVMNRTAAGYATMKLAALSTATESDLSKNTPLGAPMIPAATASGPGTLILSSGTAPPAGVTLTNVVNIKTLGEGVGTSEYVLLRPRLASGAQSVSTDSNNTFDEGTAAAPNFGEMVPVDQIDTGSLTAAATGTDYSYRRANGPTNCAWNFVYPGKYSFTTTVAAYRQDGWVVDTGTPAVEQGLGLPKTAFSSPATLTSATYRTVPVQMANMDSAGWQQSTTTGNHFPFGGFARNGDLLQVPFTCGYRVLLPNTSLMTTPPTGTTAATRMVEMNSLSMDTAFADDQDAADDMPSYTAAPATIPQLYEQIGRFCPVGDPSNSTNPTVPDAIPNDFRPGALTAGVTATNTNAYNWRYHWTRKLFDFVTVQAPHDDYFPNVDPYDYPGTVPPVASANRKSAVANATIAKTSEDTVGVEGLININTAPFPVLCAIPFFTAGSDVYSYAGGNAQGTTAADTIDDNANLAQAILDYRETKGPFKSIYDLYKVPFFKYVSDQLALAVVEPNVTTGDFSPFNAALATTPTDTVRYDFEERFLLMNRISNLITTHSDTFTCYVLLQGYRNAESGSPTLVVQRRATYLLDRNNVTPNNRTPSLTVVPTN